MTELDVLRWLNARNFRYVYPGDARMRVLDRLLAQGLAGHRGTRHYITRLGFEKLNYEPHATPNNGKSEER